MFIGLKCLSSIFTVYIYGVNVSKDQGFLFISTDQKCQSSKFPVYIYGVEVSKFKVTVCLLKEEPVLFNNALSTFYLRLYGVRHMVKYHSDSERGNPLPLLHQSWNIDWNEK